jgi:hypothetical protein
MALEKTQTPKIFVSPGSLMLATTASAHTDTIFYNYNHRKLSYMRTLASTQGSRELVVINIFWINKTYFSFTIRLS